MTTCMGWAAFDLDLQLVQSGAWNLGQPADAHDGDRWIAFRGKIGQLLATYHGRICAIGFERPSTVQWATARIAFGQAAIIELDAAKQIAEKLRSDEADARAIAMAMITIYTVADLRRRVLVKRPAEPKPRKKKAS